MKTTHTTHNPHKPRILILLAILATSLPAALALWTADAETRAHYTPECPRADLTPILQKEALSPADYALLLQQTGLAQAGVDQLYASGQQWRLLGLQERFLAPVELECSRDALFVRSERLTDSRELANDGNLPQLQMASIAGKEAAQMPEFDFMPTVQTGDILVTFNGHVFGWRSGHAAMVVDAEERLTLEAIMPGYDSKICSLEDWQAYPGFALLRLKGASRQEREQIAAYARDHLTGIPYRLASFTDTSAGASADTSAEDAVRKTAAHEAPGAIAGEAAVERGAAVPTHIPATAEMERPLTGTQCAHLVWFAYYRFGYDLDSDGGCIVTPENLYHSDLLELIQVYGLPPNS